VIRNEVFGYDMTPFLSVDDAVDYIFNGSIDEKLPVVATINLDQLVKFEAVPKLKQFICKSFMIVPDGAPIVFSSKFLGVPLPTRISGADMFPLFWEKVIRSGDSVLCVTPSERVAGKLKESNPLAICWTPPYFDSSNHVEVEAVGREFVSKISASGASYIVVGIGLPNRETLTEYALNVICPNDSPRYLLFGAAFEFYIGEKVRAPKIMQKFGLEWLHRFISEPRRLFRRYFVDSLGFVKIFIKYYREREG
jgi:N-acetylglucosaminyldiphosphoundecaprenol N-acetyl-beta-D-mannosaminyltransferase